MINMYKLSKAYIEHVYKLPTIYTSVEQFCDNICSPLYYCFLYYDDISAIYATYPYHHLGSYDIKQLIRFTISKNIDKLFESYPQINAARYISSKYHFNPEQYVIEDINYILVICYETINAIDDYYYMYVFDKNYHFLDLEIFSPDTLNILDNKYYLQHIHDTTYNRIKSLVTIHML